MVGSALLRDCRQVGIDECVVVAASMTARTGLNQWLEEYGILVLTSGGLERDRPAKDRAFVVGPPRFFRSSLVTAPLTGEVTFLLPAWYRDRSVPSSAIAAYAEGAIRVKAKVFTEGDTSEPALGVPAETEDEEGLPPAAHLGHASC